MRLSGDPEPLLAIVRESIAEGKPHNIGVLADVGESARPLVPDVAKFLAHKSHWVRMTTAEALGEIGGEQARKALERQLEVEENAKVLESIREALVQLAD